MTSGSAAASPEPEVWDDLELHTAVMVRNFELLRRRADVYGELGRADYLLLRTLETSGPTDIGGLARAVGLDPSTAGRQVAAMQAAGLVERSEGPGDRRRSIISPSRRGLTLMREVRERRRRTTEQLLGDWSADDVRCLAAMFCRWNQAITSTYLQSDSG